MKRVKIIKQDHPHFGETGIIVKENVPLSLSFLGVMDEIKGDEGGGFFAKKSDYKVISESK